MMRYPGHDGEARVQSGGSPTGLEAQEPKQKKKGRRWWEKLAWICCGIDRDEEGDMRMQSVKPRRITPAPLFVGATNTNIPNVDVGA